MIDLHDFVYIVRSVEEKYDRHKTRQLLWTVPGRVVGIEGDRALVAYYGETHHFSPKGAKFGQWSEWFPVENLMRRDPNYEDPYEFLLSEERVVPTDEAY